MEKEQPKDVVFVKYEKTEDGKETDKVKCYQIYTEDKQYVAYPNPIFESRNKENETECRIEPMTEKKGLKRFSVTVNWPADDENGIAPSTAKYIAYQRRDKNKKPTDYYNVSNEVKEGESVTFPKSTPEEPGQANFLKVDVDKNGNPYIKASVEGYKVGVCFKVSDGTVYEVKAGAEGEAKTSKVQGASFQIKPHIKDDVHVGDRFMLNFKKEEPIAFYKKAEGKAFTRMTGQREKTVEVAPQAEAAQAEAAQATEAAAETVEAAAEATPPKRRGRPKV